MSLTRAAGTIFTLTAILPLLLFLYTLWHLELLDDTVARTYLALALLISLLGFLVFWQVVSRISQLAEAMRLPDPTKESLQRGRDAALIPALGRVTEIGDFAQALGRMLEDLKSSTERLEDLVFKLGMLNETVELASRIPRTDDLLTHILERTMRAVQATIGSIMLLDPDRQTLRVAVARGLPTGVYGTEVRLGEGISGRVADMGEAVVVDDIEADPRFSKTSDPKYGSGSFVSLPLRVGDRIIGVVNLARKESLLPMPRTQPAFSPTDFQFLNALMTHTAYAVDNARLLEEARRSTERLHQVVEDQKLRLTLAQQQMVQAAKLSALGQLVAGVAHELNNPLTILLGYTELAASDASEDERRRIEVMHDAADRARRIVEGLLTFARRLPLQRVPIDLTDLVAKVLEVTSADLQLAGVSVEQDVTPDVPRIWADLHQLQQVLLNLVTNAKQAMADVDGPRHLRLAARSAGADRVRIMVEDTGPGIPSELLPSVFDPFVTTKGAAGTGLGLSISYGIIREHGGEIRVDSAPGSGTTFIIELPIGSGAAEGSARAHGVAPVDLAGKRILVVEDDPRIQEIARTFLEKAGCETRTVGSAEEALKHLEEPLDVMLVDYYLPGMNGLDLAREAVARHPRLAGRILVMSGGAVPDSVPPDVKSIPQRILAKPFTQTQLLAAVREVLG